LLQIDQKNGKIEAIRYPFFAFYYKKIEKDQWLFFENLENKKIF